MRSAKPTLRLNRRIWVLDSNSSSTLMMRVSTKKASMRNQSFRSPYLFKRRFRCPTFQPGSTLESNRRSFKMKLSCSSWAILTTDYSTPTTKIALMLRPAARGISQRMRIHAPCTNTSQLLSNLTPTRNGLTAKHTVYWTGLATLVDFLTD